MVNFLDNDSIAEKCLCSYKNLNYDFCYHTPYDRSSKGLRFNCSYATNLEELGLLQPDVIDLSSRKMPQPTFIAAISQNHYHEGMTMLANFRGMFPHQKIFVYDLGLQPELRKEIESKCLVEVRTFPFSHYQSNMRRLTEYRWKAIILAMAIREFGAVWYMDTSIRWMKDIRPLVYDAYENKKRNGLRFPRFVLCSLEENCIAPSGAKRSCEFARDRYEKYADCHRFDQSVINLLLANAYRCNVSNYFSAIRQGVKAIHNEDHNLKEVDFACSYKEDAT